MTTAKLYTGMVGQHQAIGPRLRPSEIKLLAACDLVSPAAGAVADPLSP